jgi:fumarylpyruvate hydrolase
VTAEHVFAPPPPPAVAVHGGGGAFPVRRIFCIGKNYADHVAEMGGDPKADPPVFFTKPADAVVAAGAVVPYPPATDNFHYEGELVVALKSGGRDLPDAKSAGALIFGHAAGCDLTRRDLQAAAKKAGGPWDAAKAFDHSAPIGPVARVEDVPSARLAEARLRLCVNGAEKQSAPLAAMIWKTPEIIMELSKLFELRAGDLIFTGTPAGVGALKPGDAVKVAIDGLPPLDFRIGDAR